ncbi:hypothetical protein [Azohydromonas australica]|uniref:hypothetical protein n=1 Tax=Azohydromonas australica TaxID=364039 RepID=UPI0003F9B3B0|nr:hypothetical protein [Azohydromonas australica]
MNILICGAMRSGKTALAESMAKSLGFSYLPSDSLVLALRESFPDTAIGAPGKSLDELCAGFAPFVEKLLLQLGKNGRMNYVIDGHFIRPQDVKRFGPNCRALFLGYPGAVPEARVEQLRTYGKVYDCFTNKIDDSELLNRVTRWVEHSRALRKECLEHQVPFLDVIGQDGRFCNISLEQALKAIGLVPVPG